MAGFDRPESSPDFQAMDIMGHFHEVSKESAALHCLLKSEGRRHFEVGMELSGVSGCGNLGKRAVD